MKELSVVIPAFNEEADIEATLEETVSYLRNKNYRFEVLVLNDGSTDRTVEKVSGLARRYSEIVLKDDKKNLGKGERVRQGIAGAQYPFCLFMDADNSTSIREWEKFEKHFEKGADIVIASRHLPDSVIQDPQPFLRRFLGSGYRLISRSFLGLSASDFNCGFKAYRTDIARRLYADSVMNDWTFDVEIFCLMKKNSVSFAEVPVTWAHKGKHVRPSSFGPIRTAFKTLGSFARIWKRF